MYIYNWTFIPTQCWWRLCATTEKSTAQKENFSGWKWVSAPSPSSIGFQLGQYWKWFLGSPLLDAPLWLVFLSLSLLSIYFPIYTQFFPPCLYFLILSLFVLLYSFFLCWTADAPSPFNSSYIYILGDVVASARCLLSLLCVIGANIVVNGRTNSLDFSFVLPSDVV